MMMMALELARYGGRGARSRKAGSCREEERSASIPVRQLKEEEEKENRKESGSWRG
jgi:hypothetical protein